MASKCQRLVAIAVLALLFNCHASEASEPSNDPLSVVNPPIIVNILNDILQSRGTSLQQIHDKLASVHQDVEFVVSEINTQLSANILRVVGEVIRVNAENVKDLLKDAIHVIVRNGFPNNPFMAAIVEATVVGQLEAQFQEIYDAIESIAIPINTGVVQEGKSKRSLQPRAADLTAIISDIAVNLLQGQLTNVVSDLLEIVKSVLSQLYITTPPADDIIGTVVAYAQNLLIDNVVEIITNLQGSITATAAEIVTESVVSTVLV